jgi:hypothetical protein
MKWISDKAGQAINVSAQRLSVQRFFFDQSVPLSRVINSSLPRGLPKKLRGSLSIWPLQRIWA